jgi:hypothetical protein
MAVSDRKAALDQIKKSAWLWIPACAPIPLFGAIGIILYAWSQDSLSIFSVAMLVACGAWIAGGLLGFIFGIPRALATDRPETSVAGLHLLYRSNSNLEQISDWLTKIIVGVSLVEFRTLISETSKLVDFLAPALGGAPYGRSFALGVLITFAISGFVVLYIFTRVYLAVLFAGIEKDLDAGTDLNEPVVGPPSGAGDP